MNEVATEHLKFVDAYPDKASKYAQKLHIKKDDIQFIRKVFLSDKHEPIDEKEAKKLQKERAVVSYITTENIDRDGEQILASGIRTEHYEASGKPVFFGHQYRSPSDVVGQCQWIKHDSKNRGLVAKTVFRNNQRSDDVYKLYTENLTGQGPILRGFSIGFIPLKFSEPAKKGSDEKNVPKRIYEETELLEYSCVPIMSNRQSLSIIQAAYQKGVLNSESIKKYFFFDEDTESEPDPDTPVSDLADARIDEQIEAKEAKDYEDIDSVADDVGKEDVSDFQEDKDEEIVGDVSPKENVLTESEFAEIAEVAVKGLEKVVSKNEENQEAIDEAEDEGDSLPENLGELKKKALEKTVIETFIELEEKTDIHQKPETTDNFHHVPAPGQQGKHGGHPIITKALGKGIKMRYCTQCKVAVSYMFPTDKYTMAQAQAWVRENGKTFGFYKERWNKSLSTKFNVSYEGVTAADDEEFDIEAVEVHPAGFNYAIYSKFLKCKVKDVFPNRYFIPSPLLGNYLTAFKENLKEYDLKDIRNFTNDGAEAPPAYEVIQLNSKKSDDFLVHGMCFYQAGKERMIVRFDPSWSGLYVTIVTDTKNKGQNKELLGRVCRWAKEHNYLKGEKFALSGEFLPESEDDWDSLKIGNKTKDTIQKSINALNKKGQGFDSRGLLFVGKPGTGKTKTGRILLNEIDATFIWVSSKDLKRMSTLYALSLGFEMARDLAPSILFIEDVDAWLGGYSTTVDLLKTEMDGLKQNKGTITILTSNFPEQLPDALLDRPGRFHHVIEFELPNPEKRKEMLLEWAGKVDELTVKEILEKTDGFSGAHMKELVDFAKMIAEEDKVEMGEALLRSLKRLMEQKELIAQLRDNREGKGIEGFMAKMKAIDDSQTIEIEEPGSETIEIEDYNMTEDKTIEIEGVDEEGEKQRDELVPEETLTCECPKCGHKGLAKPGQACKDLKCPECGATMRVASKSISCEGVDDDVEIEITEERESQLDYFQKCLDTLDLGYQLSEIDEFEMFGAGFVRLRVEEKDYYFGSDAKQLSEKIDTKEEKVINQNFAILEDMIKDLQAEITELKEGRILSSKNRTLVKETMDILQELFERLQKLYQATEPTQREEAKESDDVIEILPPEKEGKAKDSQDTEEIASLIKQAMKSEEGKKIFKDAMRDSAKVAIAEMKGKVIVEDE